MRKKHQNYELFPTTLMCYYFADFARSLMMMLEHLPSYDDDCAPYRKLAALYADVSITVNNWILDIGEGPFAHCISPVCSFIENILNVIHENIVYHTDIQICEHCDEAEAEIQLKILEGKRADFDRYNDSNSEHAGSTALALAAELKAQEHILTSSPVGLRESQAAIETLRNYVTKLKILRWTEFCIPLQKKKQDNDTLRQW